MRERIRFTNRKEISVGSIQSSFKEKNKIPIDITLSVKDPSEFESFPVISNVRLRLEENKKINVIHFGNLKDLLNRPITSNIINPLWFKSPSCELKISVSEGKDLGKILGSTAKWKLRPLENGSDDIASRGLLSFMYDDIKPLIWNLEFPEDDYPILCVEKSIPQSSDWFASNGMFCACVYPVVVRMVFQKIFDLNDLDPGNYQLWVTDWLRWAEDISNDVYRTNKIIIFDKSPDEREEWINDMIINFSQKQSFLSRFLGFIQTKEDLSL